MTKAAFEEALVDAVAESVDDGVPIVVRAPSDAVLAAVPAKHKKHKFVGAKHLKPSIVKMLGVHNNCYACGSAQDDQDHDGDVDMPGDVETQQPVAASALTSDKTHLPASSLSRITGKTRERAAERGQAMPDGSFPIRDGADLKRAIQAFGRAKDKGAAKRHIIRRARALGKTELLPDTWKSLATREFGKREIADALVAAATQPVVEANPLELLAAKAEKYDVPLAKLKVVYDRGLTAAGVYTCVSREELAHARVNSFLLAVEGKRSTCQDFDLLPTSHPARQRPA